MKTVLLALASLLLVCQSAVAQSRVVTCDVSGITNPGYSYLNGSYALPLAGTSAKQTTWRVENLPLPQVVTPGRPVVTSLEIFVATSASGTHCEVWFVGGGSGVIGFRRTAAAADDGTSWSGHVVPGIGFGGAARLTGG